jgi:hypothetical protein
MRGLATRFRLPGFGCCPVSMEHEDLVRFWLALLKLERFQQSQ